MFVVLAGQLEVRPPDGPPSSADAQAGRRGEHAHHLSGDLAISV
jgi:hypothetical protein